MVSGGKAGHWCIQHLRVALLLSFTLLCGCDSKKSAGDDSSAREGDSCKNDCLLLPSSNTLAAVLAHEDTDADQRITILDKGGKWFSVPSEGGNEHRISGTYHLANLVQELFLAHLDERSSIPLKHVEEPIANRISRLIKERYWTGLTRRIDFDALKEVLPDPKTDSKKRVAAASWPKECTAAPAGIPQFLYVPYSDDEALKYYATMTASHPSLVVCRLPKVITPQWVHSLDATAEHGSRHGLLSLALKRVQGKLQAVPYGVPGGRFNEMYGWDSYFHVLGLLQDQKLDLARSLVDNQLYEIRHYGKVLNANRSYYLTRSQPPFLSSAVRAVWQRAKDLDWLKDALGELIKEYEGVWNSGDRLSPLCRAVFGENDGADQVCLATYHAAGLGEPPEVEPGHYDWYYQKRAAQGGGDASDYRRRYRKRELPDKELSDVDWFFMHDRSMRESGHDTTYRWTTIDGDRCADFATIDLNALLFKVELDLATLSKEADIPNWQRWCDRATARRDLVQEYLYNGEIFVDYQLGRDAQRRFDGSGKKSTYVSATTLYPLWASAESPCSTPSGEALSLLRDGEQAKRLVESALKHLETPGGLASSARSSVSDAGGSTPRQWDYPFGWAPHQILAWEGLRRHGFNKEADRLSYRWLYMISKNAHDFHGTVPEKFDVLRRSHQVFAEYGNVGSEFSYITREGFGWMNASFQLGKSKLPKQLLSGLNSLKPPEEFESVLH